MILEKIAADTRERVEAQKRQLPFTKLRTQAEKLENQSD